MAPLFHLFLALFLVSSSVVASPHISRNPHAHHAVAARHPIDVLDRSPVIPKRKRSLNKRCIPRPSNATTTTTSSSSTMSSSTPSPSPYSTPLNVAPSPSPSSYSTPLNVAPPPSPSPTPTPTSSSPAAPAQTSPASSSGNSGGPSFLNGQQMGQGTFYSTGLGACGITNNDQQHICAVSHLLYDAYPGYNGVNPNNNPVCGRQITIRYNGKSVTVTVTDRCEGCALTDLDLSPSAFDALADPSVGRIDIDWDWV